MKTFILKLAPKHCELDPISTLLLFEYLDETLPSITHVINSSLTPGILLSVYKTAVVKPLIQKPSLDQNDLKSYRLVSNLSIISKINEKIVLSQISDCLSKNDIFSHTQFAYGLKHNTETVLLKIMIFCLLLTGGGLYPNAFGFIGCI